MSRIEIGRYSDRLRRMFGMKGASDVARELSPEISPIVVLEGPGAEWDFLQGVRICGVTGDILASGANRSVVRLRNDALSGIIATVTLSSYTSANAAAFTLQRGRATADLVTTMATAIRDSRWEALSVLIRTAISASFSNAGAVPTGEDVLWDNRVLADVQAIYSEEIILTPGDSLDLASTGVNVAIRPVFAWKERPISALEL